MGRHVREWKLYIYAGIATDREDRQLRSMNLIIHLLDIHTRTTFPVSSERACFFLVLIHYSYADS